LNIADLNIPLCIQHCSCSNVNFWLKW